MPAVIDAARACQAAVDSIEANIGETLDAGTGDCSKFPDGRITKCSASDTDLPLPSEVETFATASGAYTLLVRYPVKKASITEAAYKDGVGTDDGRPCERMSVSLQKSDDTHFDGFTGTPTLRTTAAAVVVGSLESTGVSAPAFLLLERFECAVLTNSVNGSGNDGIIVNTSFTSVNGVQVEQAGLIHIDTNSTTACQSTPYAVYGTTVQNGDPSVNVKSVRRPDGTILREAKIQMAVTNGRDGAVYPGGLSVEPSYADPVSRAPINDKYESSDNPAISSLHTAARTAVRASGIPGSPFVSVGCTPSAADLEDRTHVFVNCSTGFGPNNTITEFTDAEEVIFSHGVSLGNGSEARFPVAKKVTVRGALAVPQGRLVAPRLEDLFVGNRFTVGGGGRVALNSTSHTACEGGESAAVRLAVFGGTSQPNGAGFDSSGSVTLCSTTMYLAGPSNRAFGFQQLAGNTPAGCTLRMPCPNSNTATNLAVGARPTLSGSIVWHAPDNDPASGPIGLEDLALWAEGAATTSISSGGTLIFSGVFFTPNSLVNITSPANALPQSAQFVARKLNMNQGTLRMEPNPEDSIRVATAGSYSLIR